MLTSHKLAVEIQERKKRLLELAGVDEPTEDQNKEREEIRSKLVELEDRRLSAIEGEQVDQSDTEMELDAEGRERARLEERASFANYLMAGYEERAVDGAEKELNDAMGIKHGSFPLSMLAPKDDRRDGFDRNGIETRADAVTSLSIDTAQRPRSFLDRLFKGSAVQHLGISPTSVPAGVDAYPVTTGGVTAQTVTKGTKKEAEEFTATVETLKPLRCSASVIYSKEDAHRIPQLEDAIRRDMRNAFVDAMSNEVINGVDGASNATVITGLVETGTPLKIDGTADGNLSAASTGTQIVSGFLSLVDGIHAQTPGDLRALVAPELMAYMGSLTDGSTNAPDQYITDILSRKGVSVMATDHISEIGTSGDAAGDSYAVISRGRGLAGAVQMPVWAGASLIVDPYSRTQQGEILLTLVSFWNFAVVRDSNFALRRIARS